MTPFLSRILFVFPTTVSQFHTKPRPGLQQSCTAPVTTALTFSRREKQKKEGKGRNRDRSHISEVTAPAAALSNNPNSMVPGRDYPDRQLSALKLSWRGGGGGYVWSVIKWERGGMGQWYGGLAEGDRTRRGWARRLTDFLSLSQWTGMLGWMTNPRNPSEWSALTQLAHTLRTGAHYITSSWSHHAAG